MLKDDEVKMVVDKLFKEEEGQDVEFGEAKLVSEDWLKRRLTYEEVKKIFNAYYKKVDEAETKHAKEQFDGLKKDMTKFTCRVTITQEGLAKLREVMNDISEIGYDADPASLIYEMFYLQTAGGSFEDIRDEVEVEEDK